MRRGAIAMLMAVGLAAGAATSSAAPPRSCHAKGAAYRHGAVRVYLRGLRVRTYYLCSASIRTPLAYHSRRIASDEDVPGEYRIRAGRLLYDDFVVKTQTALFAWVDLHSAAYRETSVPGYPQVAPDVWSVGPGGGIAFVTDHFAVGETIWYAAPGSGALAPARALV